MKRFFFHVGLPRCASTTIGTVFLEPGQLGAIRLEEAGIRPMKELKDKLRAAAAEPAWHDEFVAALRRDHVDPIADEDGIEGLFVSEEGMSLTYSEEHPAPDLENRVACAQRLMDGFEPHIVFVVRNQVAYIQSLYGLHVQNAGKMLFPDFVNSLALGVMDWHAVVTSYAAQFGADRVTVLPLEGEMYRDGKPGLAGYGGFLDALQGVLGIDQPFGPNDVKLFNPSLPPLMMQVQQQINERIDDENAKIVADVIRSCLTGPARKGFVPMSLLGEDQQAQIKSAFAATNAALFADFMPNFDPGSYLPSS